MTHATLQTADDSHWMLEALRLARQAECNDEVPVGAVVVNDNAIVGVGYNACITLSDPTAHAEIVAIRAACSAIGNYRLPGACLYVTLEPCAMCAGAIVHARIGRVVFGTPDPRAGAGGSIVNLLQHAALNHQAELVSGVEEQACALVLTDFFKARRKKT